jgi:hypothetical protein
LEKESTLQKSTMKINENCSVSMHYYPDKILISKDPIYFKTDREKRVELMKNNRKTVYNGFMSDSTARKVRRIITTWGEAIKQENNLRNLSLEKIDRQLVFITLSLSDDQKHSDLYIKRNLLNRFIIILKDMFHVKHYLWKAEKMKNGRIHFHVMVDHFCNYKQIQEEWNAIQRDHGYIDNYMAKFNNENPPSTHIFGVNSDSEACEYMIKYLSKKEQQKLEEDNKVEGRIWGCSDDLRNLRVFSSPEDSKLIEMLYAHSEQGTVKKIEDEFYCLYITDVKKFIIQNSRRIYIDYCNYYESVYKNLYSVQKTCQTGYDIVKQEYRQTELKQKQPIQLSLFEYISTRLNDAIFD